MIVLLDAENQTISIYTDRGRDEYYFDEIDDLADVIKDSTVLYVTQAIETNAKDLTDLVLSMTDGGQPSSQFDHLDAGIQYLQSQTKGALHLSEIGITFNNKGDCKIIDERMYDLIEKSPTIRELIKQGKIKVIDHGTMKRVSRKQHRKQRRDQEERLKAIDERFDDILVKSDKPGSAEMVASTGEIFDDSEDITEDILNDPMSKMSAEEYAAAVREGRLAP